MSFRAKGETDGGMANCAVDFRNFVTASKNRQNRKRTYNINTAGLSYLCTLKFSRMAIPFNVPWKHFLLLTTVRVL